MGKKELYRLFIKYRIFIALALIAALSFGLNFYAISKLGYGNAYYAAAIKSMSMNFKNFFYLSFDPAGMVSVDKSPLGLWIQVLFVKIFGYSGWAMLLPQALAGTGSCLLMYGLTAKRFGRPAGLIAALVFALMPAVIVASRNNTIDMQLIFFLLVAAWFLFKSIEKKKWRYLFLCAVFIGLGFNIKMLQAYLALPAIALVYLIFAREKFYKRILAGLISIVIMAAVSFSWVLAVELTPAENRPYVDSTVENSELELVIGHNGLERVYGRWISGIPGSSPFSGRRDAQNPPGNRNDSGFPDGRNPGNNQDGANPANGNPGFNPPRGNGPGNGPGNPGSGPGMGLTAGPRGGGVAGNEIGTEGILRLFSSSLFGQASWLFTFLLFCAAVMFKASRLKQKLSLRQGVFAFWVIWFLTMYIFFSFAGFWHRYYLCMFAPAVSGIAGPGFIKMTRAFRNKKGWKKILLPASLVVTVVIELLFVLQYPLVRDYLAPVMIAAAVASLVFMAVRYFGKKKFALYALIGCMLLSMLAAPLYWSATVVIYEPQNITMPYAGPELASTEPVPGMTPNQQTLKDESGSSNSLEQYLVAHYKEGTFLVVSRRANDVAGFIVDTGLPAYAYGGFLGSDNSLTVDKLKELVKQGKITYFLVSGQNVNASLDAYVIENAKRIDPSEYGGSSLGTLYFFENTDG